MSVFNGFLFGTVIGGLTAWFLPGARGKRRNHRMAAGMVAGAVAGDRYRRRHVGSSD